MVVKQQTRTNQRNGFYDKKLIGQADTCQCVTLELYIYTMSIKFKEKNNPLEVEGTKKYI